MAEADTDFAFAPKKPYFACFSNAEIKQKEFNQIPKNILKSEKNADTIFTKYLEEQDGIVNHDYWVYPDEELDKILVKFWFSLRKPSGQKYSMSTLQNIKNALNRQLQCKGHFLDISKDLCYVNSQWAFKDACKELKSEGFGHITSFPEIEMKDENHSNILSLTDQLSSSKCKQKLSSRQLLALTPPPFKKLFGRNYNV